MRISSNLSVRIMAILLGGFVLWQLVVFAITTLPSGDDGRRPYNLPSPGETAMLVAAVERTPAAERAALVDAIGSGLYTLRLRPEPPDAAPTTPAFAPLRRSYAAALPGRAISVTGRRARLSRLIGADPRPARFFAPVTVAIALGDGSTLTMVSQPSAEIRGYLRNRAFLGALGGGIVLAILLFAVRQSVRPLTRLSDRVRQLGKDLDAPDLPGGGPREVAELSAAFNEMKARIRGLMAERTRMLAGIAHDMRTYLTRLRLRAEYIDDPGHRERATRDLDEMTALLNDTLLLAEHDAQPHTVPRLDLAAELTALVAMRRELGEPVEAAFADTPAWVRANPLSLRRIAGNLIDNAIRHGGGATVRIERDDTGAALIVEDTGPGVPADALEHLGEAFNRVDPSRNRGTGGAGLGLAIVRALAARDGGEASFANRPEGGFRARVRFPAADPRAPA